MALTYTWTVPGPGDGTNWTDQNNWTPVGVPGSLDTAIVVLTGTLLGDKQTVGTLIISGGTLGQFHDLLTAATAEVQGGLAIAGTLDATVADFTNATTIDANALTSVSGLATIGNVAAGTLVVAASGSLASGILLAGGATGIVGVLDAAGGYFNVAGGASLGVAGTGDLTVDSSAVGDIAGSLAAGISAGASGAIAVTNVGSLAIGGAATLAAAGAARVTIDASSSLTIAGDLAVAVSAGATATIDVSGTSPNGGVLAVGGNVTLAPGGSALLTAENSGQLVVSGGDTTTNQVLIGAAGTLVAQTGGGITANAILMSDGARLTLQSGAAATLNGGADTPLDSDLIGLDVNGIANVNSASVTSTGDLLVGASTGAGGTGTLDITNTGNVGGIATVLGQFAGNHGTLLVTGNGANTGTNLSDTDGLTVGNAGTGVLSLQNGGLVNDTLDAAVGAEAGGWGTVTVQGSGSDWSVGGTLTVGNAGTASVTVGSGGAVTTGGTMNTGALDIGGGATGSGTVSIDGARWANNGPLTVGDAGRGSLTIGTAIFSSNGDIIVGNQAGGVGTLTVTNVASKLSDGGNTVIGNAGTGTFLLGTGAVFASVGGSVDLGVSTGAVGSLQVNGALTVTSADLDVGVAGLGLLGVGAGGTVVVNGSLAVGAAGLANGTITLGGGTLSAANFAVASSDIVTGHGNLVASVTGINEGLIEAVGGKLKVNAAVTTPSGAAGTLEIAGGSELDLTKSTDVRQTIVFQGSSSAEVLGLSAPLAIASVIEGFSGQATFDLFGVAHTDTQTPTYSSATHVLTITDNGALEATLTLDPATLLGTNFQLADDTVGTGTDITVACFAAGTRIATTRGDIAVERLYVGDRVVHPDGGVSPVTWLGHRNVDCSRHPRPHDVLPIRVMAGAFGPGLPRRDLRLSPDHAVFVDDVLIPIRYLVNGVSVARERVGRVSYHHVELPRHGILLAEDLPAESYLDAGNRDSFVNGERVIALHADFSPHIRMARGCADLVVAGPIVAAVRRRLAVRVKVSRLYPAIAAAERLLLHAERAG